MKFKTTAIALAVAGIVAAPVAVQAGADEVYASARIGVWNVDQNDVQNTEVKSFSSRFGAKGETDLGNGLTGFGRYEWDVDENDFAIRHRYVGLKGDFGSVLLGQTYHTFYNFAGGAVDNPWWHSGYAMVDFRGRTDDAVSYAGGSGDFNFGATVYAVADGDAVAKGGDADDEDDIDAFELGGSMAIGDMTLGLAYASTETTQGSDESDEDIMAAALTGIALGDTTWGFVVEAQEDDSSFAVHGDISNFYVHVEALFLDKDSGSNDSTDNDDQDIVSTTLGYTQSLGRKTTMYYELNYIDRDTGRSSDDRTAAMAVLKYDII